MERALAVCPARLLRHEKMTMVMVMRRTMSVITLVHVSIVLVVRRWSARVFD